MEGDTENGEGGEIRLLEEEEGRRGKGRIDKRDNGSVGGR